MADSEKRIVLPEGMQLNLLCTLDFWFTFASYAGIRPPHLLLELIARLIFAAFFGYRTIKAISPIPTLTT